MRVHGSSKFIRSQAGRQADGYRPGEGEQDKVNAETNMQAPSFPQPDLKGYDSPDKAPTTETWLHSHPTSSRGFIVRNRVVGPALLHQQVSQFLAGTRKVAEVVGPPPMERGPLVDVNGPARGSGQRGSGRVAVYHRRGRGPTLVSHHLGEARRGSQLTSTNMSV